MLPFVAVGIVLVLRTLNNTDGNKLVIFSGIASYYGDNYIVPFHISTLHSSSITNSYPPRENNDCLTLESQHGENEMM